jgi:uncharacterized phage protein gp47/JayE
MSDMQGISADMRRAMALAEPGMDTGIGSITRKLIDMVAEAIAETQAEGYMLALEYDIDAKSGAALDDFVRRFGFDRYPAKRSTGTITFSRTTPYGEDIFIPPNTQVRTASGVTVRASTIVPAFLKAGDTEVSVPAQAVDPGSIGSVSAGTLTTWVNNAISNIEAVTNPVAFSGGADQEDDVALRIRFKRTVFRNLAGTESMFTAVALEDPAVTQVNVVGASKRFFERIEILSGTATSTIQDASYIYPTGQFFGTDLSSGEIFTHGVHYNFDASVNPPVVTALDATEVPNGAVYDLEFEYSPQASRNEPENGITNRVDIYVNGSRAQVAVETMKFSNALTFNNTVGSAMKRTNFQRLDGSHPSNLNVFIPLGYTPVLDPSLNDEIDADGDTWVEGTDYWLVNDITNEGGTPHSRSGLEWRVVANGASDIPANGSVFTVEYVYNDVPRSIETALRMWRLVTTDVQVHQATTIFLNINLVVMITVGYVISSVEGDIEAAVGRLVDSIGFNGVLQVSDVLTAVGQVPGVDAVRYATSTDDAVHYATQHVAANGVTVIETYASGGRARDVLTGDSEILILNNVRLIERAQNSFYEGA